MYKVFAVVVVGSVKHRYFLEETASMDEAKHMANRATCGNAAYAYVKDTDGQTIFFLPRPAGYYDIKGPTVLRSISPVTPDQQTRKYRQHSSAMGQNQLAAHLSPANS